MYPRVTLFHLFFIVFGASFALYSSSDIYVDFRGSDGDNCGTYDSPCQQLFYAHSHLAGVEKILIIKTFGTLSQTVNLTDLELIGLISEYSTESLLSFEKPTLQAGSGLIVNEGNMQIRHIQYSIPESIGSSQYLIHSKKGTALLETVSLSPSRSVIEIAYPIIKVDDGSLILMNFSISKIRSNASNLITISDNLYVSLVQIHLEEIVCRRSAIFIGAMHDESGLDESQSGIIIENSSFSSIIALGGNGGCFNIELENNTHLTIDITNSFTLCSTQNGDGGAIYLRQNPKSRSNIAGFFYYCTASPVREKNGGGIYIYCEDGGNNFQFGVADFYNCTAQLGHAVYVSAETLTALADQGRFQQNTVGGSVYENVWGYSRSDGSSYSFVYNNYNVPLEVFVSSLGGSDENNCTTQETRCETLQAAVARSINIVITVTEHVLVNRQVTLFQHRIRSIDQTLATLLVGVNTAVDDAIRDRGLLFVRNVSILENIRLDIPNYLGLPHLFYIDAETLIFCNVYVNRSTASSAAIPYTFLTANNGSFNFITGVMQNLQSTNPFFNITVCSPFIFQGVQFENISVTGPHSFIEVTNLTRQTSFFLCSFVNISANHDGAVFWMKAGSAGGGHWLNTEFRTIRSTGTRGGALYLVTSNLTSYENPTQPAYTFTFNAVSFQGCSLEGSDSNGGALYVDCTYYMHNILPLFFDWRVEFLVNNIAYRGNDIYLYNAIYTDLTYEKFLFPIRDSDGISFFGLEGDRGVERSITRSIQLPQLLFVDSAAGEDVGDCMLRVRACRTLNHALSLASSRLTTHVMVLTTSGNTVLNREVELYSAFITAHTSLMRFIIDVTRSSSDSFEGYLTVRGKSDIFLAVFRLSETLVHQYFITLIGGTLGLHSVVLQSAVWSYSLSYGMINVKAGILFGDITLRRSSFSNTAPSPFLLDNNHEFHLQFEISDVHTVYQPILSILEGELPTHRGVTTSTSRTSTGSTLTSVLSSPSLSSSGLSDPPTNSYPSAGPPPNASSFQFPPGSSSFAHSSLEEEEAFSSFFAELQVPMPMGMRTNNNKRLRERDLQQHDDHHRVALAQAEHRLFGRALTLTHPAYPALSSSSSSSSSSSFAYPSYPSSSMTKAPGRMSNQVQRPRMTVLGSFRNCTRREGNGSCIEAYVRPGYELYLQQVRFTDCSTLLGNGGAIFAEIKDNGHFQSEECLWTRCTAATNNDPNSVHLGKGGALYLKFTAGTSGASYLINAHWWEYPFVDTRATIGKAMAIEAASVESIITANSNNDIFRFNMDPFDERGIYFINSATGAYEELESRILTIVRTYVAASAVADTGMCTAPIPCRTIPYAITRLGTSMYQEVIVVSQLTLNTTLNINQSLWLTGNQSIDNSGTSTPTVATIQITPVSTTTLNSYLNITTYGQLVTVDHLRFVMPARLSNLQTPAVLWNIEGKTNFKDCEFYGVTATTKINYMVVFAVYPLSLTNTIFRDFFSSAQAVVRQGLFFTVPSIWRNTTFSQLTIDDGAALLFLESYPLPGTNPESTPPTPPSSSSSSSSSSFGNINNNSNNHRLSNQEAANAIHFYDCTWNNVTRVAGNGSAVNFPVQTAQDIIFNHCIFMSNKANAGAGAAMNADFRGSPIYFRNGCRFEKNTAQRGAAVQERIYDLTGWNPTRAYYFDSTTVFADNVASITGSNVYAYENPSALHYTQFAFSFIRTNASDTLYTCRIPTTGGGYSEVTFSTTLVYPDIVYIGGLGASDVAGRTCRDEFLPCESVRNAVAHLDASISLSHIYVVGDFFVNGQAVLQNVDIRTHARYGRGDSGAGGASFVVSVDALSMQVEGEYHLITDGGVTISNVDFSFGLNTINASYFLFARAGVVDLENVVFAAKYSEAIVGYGLIRLAHTSSMSMRNVHITRFMFTLSAAVTCDYGTSLSAIQSTMSFITLYGHPALLIEATNEMIPGNVNPTYYFDNFNFSYIFRTTGNGGAIQMHLASRANCTFRELQFYSCYVRSGNGGAVYAEVNSNSTLQFNYGVHIVGCSAGSLSSSSAGTTTATGRGGGLYIYLANSLKAADFYVTGVNFRGNEAVYGSYAYVNGEDPLLYADMTHFSMPYTAGIPIGDLLRELYALDRRTDVEISLTDLIIRPTTLYFSATRNFSRSALFEIPYSHYGVGYVTGQTFVDSHVNIERDLLLTSANETVRATLTVTSNTIDGDGIIELYTASWLNMSHLDIVGPSGVADETVVKGLIAIFFGGASFEDIVFTSNPSASYSLIYIIEAQTVNLTNVRIANYANTLQRAAIVAESDWNLISLFLKWVFTNITFSNVTNARFPYVGDQLLDQSVGGAAINAKVNASDSLLLYNCSFANCTVNNANGGALHIAIYENGTFGMYGGGFSNCAAVQNTSTTSLSLSSSSSSSSSPSSSRYSRYHSYIASHYPSSIFSHSQGLRTNANANAPACCGGAFFVDSTNNSRISFVFDVYIDINGTSNSARYGQIGCLWGTLPTALLTHRLFPFIYNQTATPTLSTCVFAGANQTSTNQIIVLDTFILKPTTMFVASTGTDTDACTNYTTPCLTIARALNNLNGKTLKEIDIVTAVNVLAAFTIDSVRIASVQFTVRAALNANALSGANTAPYITITAGSNATLEALTVTLPSSIGASSSAAPFIKAGGINLTILNCLFQVASNVSISYLTIASDADSASSIIIEQSRFADIIRSSGLQNGGVALLTINAGSTLSLRNSQIHNCSRSNAHGGFLFATIQQGGAFACRNVNFTQCSAVNLTSTLKALGGAVYLNVTSANNNFVFDSLTTFSGNIATEGYGVYLEYALFSQLTKAHFQMVNMQYMATHDLVVSNGSLEFPIAAIIKSATLTTVYVSNANVSFYFPNETYCGLPEYPCTSLNIAAQKITNVNAEIFVVGSAVLNGVVVLTHTNLIAQNDTTIDVQTLPSAPSGGVLGYVTVQDIVVFFGATFALPQYAVFGSGSSTTQLPFLYLVGGASCTMALCRWTSAVVSSPLYTTILQLGGGSLTLYSCSFFNLTLGSNTSPVPGISITNVDVLEATDSTISNLTVYTAFITIPSFVRSNTTTLSLTTCSLTGVTRVGAGFGSVLNAQIAANVILSLRGCAFTNCTAADGSGGALYFAVEAATGRFVLDLCTFTGCTAATSNPSEEDGTRGYGGSIYVHAPTAAVYGAFVFGPNNVFSLGGASRGNLIYVYTTETETSAIATPDRFQFIQRTNQYNTLNDVVVGSYANPIDIVTTILEGRKLYIPSGTVANVESCRDSTNTQCAPITTTGLTQYRNYLALPAFSKITSALTLAYGGYLHANQTNSPFFPGVYINLPTEVSDPALTCIGMTIIGNVSFSVGPTGNAPAVLLSYSGSLYVENCSFTQHNTSALTANLIQVNTNSFILHTMILNNFILANASLITLGIDANSNITSLAISNTLILGIGAAVHIKTVSDVIIDYSSSSSSKHRLRSRHYLGASDTLSFNFSRSSFTNITVDTSSVDAEMRAAKQVSPVTINVLRGQAAFFVDCTFANLVTNSENAGGAIFTYGNVGGVGLLGALDLSNCSFSNCTAFLRDGDFGDGRMLVSYMCIVNTFRVTFDGSVTAPKPVVTTTSFSSSSSSLSYSFTPSLSPAPLRRRPCPNKRIANEDGIVCEFPAALVRIEGGEAMFNATSFSNGTEGALSAIDCFVYIYGWDFTQNTPKYQNFPNMRKNIFCDGDSVIFVEKQNSNPLDGGFYWIRNSGCELQGDLENLTSAYFEPVLRTVDSTFDSEVLKVQMEGVNLYPCWLVAQVFEMNADQEVINLKNQEPQLATDPEHLVVELMIENFNASGDWRIRLQYENDKYTSSFFIFRKNDDTKEGLTQAQVLSMVITFVVLGLVVVIVIIVVVILVYRYKTRHSRYAKAFDDEKGGNESLTRMADVNSDNDSDGSNNEGEEEIVEDVEDSDGKKEQTGFTDD